MFNKPMDLTKPFVLPYTIVKEKKSLISFKMQLSSHHVKPSSLLPSRENNYKNVPGLIYASSKWHIMHNEMATVQDHLNQK